ncbi:GNAT family N-acetyltransferase [Salipaludibacillus sp. HK11]|uniref:GNAT family N-acetyltransferase n=1 Tax=Salipaludibacillus sp. HK11 TaxID=3394320 RepID=UPI0039FC6570
MNIRLAEPKDIKQLIRMRWDFTIEYDGSKKKTAYEDFEKECQYFLENALNSDQWFIWVCEENEKVVSHIYTELVHKVPRPGKKTYPFAYMTNVYTVPEFRNMGVGSKILKTINNWMKENHYEFVIVWPSDESINYYKKNGYNHCKEPMQYFPS